MRPTARLVTVPTANHSDPTNAVGPKWWRTTRSKKYADATAHAAPTTTGPKTAPRGGKRMLYPGRWCPEYHCVSQREKPLRTYISTRKTWAG